MIKLYIGMLSLTFQLTSFDKIKYPLVVDMNNNKV